MNRILLIEDDVSLGSTLKEGLESRGFQISWGKTCAEAHELLKRPDAKTDPYALALLDVGLPDGSGFDLAAEIKEVATFPFLFMTALNSAENRLAGYDLGAQEFIPKPFHFRELLIRMERVLRDHTPRSTTKMALPGEVVLDLEKMCVELKSGETSFIALRDFRVLKLLIDRAPKPVSRDEMLDVIWGEDQFPSQRTVDNCIVRLRQMLQDHEGQLIRSVRGMGYQWILNETQGEQK